MKKIVLLFVLISSYAFSQSINDYQYVIIPAKFSIFKDKNKYNLNTNTKFLLQKYGFKAFLVTDSIPDEIANGNCKKVYADLVSDNGLLTTKIKIVIKDCRDKILYETAFGTSRVKELPTAYNQALREAGQSFDKLNYKFNGKIGTTSETVVAVKTEPIVPERVIEPTPTTETPSATTNETFYFAQQKPYGYQVVDTEPKVIMKLYNTSQKNVFQAVKGTLNGTVILKNGQWFFEYYENEKLVSESLNLKF